jgi:uncharacterized Tic20 family protein
MNEKKRKNVYNKQITIIFIQIISLSLQSADSSCILLSCSGDDEVVSLFLAAIFVTNS